MSVKVGNSIQDIVTPGGAVQNGLAVHHKGCPVFVVRMHGRTLLDTHLHCPYCGAQIIAETPPNVRDCRPVGGD